MTIFSVQNVNRPSYIGFNRGFNSFKPLGGNGYLCSTFPDYVLTIDGSPAVGNIRVLLRTSPSSEGDGKLISSIQTSTSGEWRVDGLNPEYKYDVVARVDGYNDIVYSNITPLVD